MVCVIYSEYGQLASLVYNRLTGDSDVIAPCKLVLDCGLFSDSRCSTSSIVRLQVAIVCSFF